MTISSLGAGSGLDLSGILNSLMQVEQQPLVNLQRKEASYQARISALGSLKGALSSLQSAASGLLPSTGQTAAQKYASFSAAVADSTIASASASSSAVPGVYSLEVSSLAQSQRLATATPGSPPASPYANASATIDQGILTIELGKLDAGTYTADSARKLTITIDATNNTLGGLRDAINAANGGVSATIVSGTAGAQLVLSSKDSGTSNVMKLSGLNGFTFDPTTGTGALTQDAAQGGRGAQNAQFTLNGIAATSSTNTVTGVLDGVTLTLAKTNVGSPTNVTVSKDSTSAASKALNAFIKSFNEANKMVSDLGAYNAETKVAGPLQGQAVVRSAENQLRSLIFNTTAGGDSAYQRLSDIGISLDKSGNLSLDSGKLNKALAADYNGVIGLVEKVGTAFKTGLESMVGSTGTITGVTDNVNSMIKRLGQQQTVLTQRLTRIEERYRQQFTALDSAIAGMKQTSTYLTQQLASLPSGG
ncbi:MAG: flagellar hook-associated protein [Rhodocyclaceae bacterium]|nr:flagellar hook-associated protein [Rhodocyclaceae bacterium]